MENQITKSEQRWIWTAVAVIAAITLIPYVAGFSLQGKDWVFSGFIFGVEDGNSYIAKMLRGAAGEWFFHTPYTGYFQEGVLAFLPYYLAGKLAAGPARHEQLIAIFQALRVIGIGFVVYAAYRFSAFFISSIPLRRLSTALIVLGGGLGWLYPLGLDGLWGGRIPLEFYSPESFGFLAILGLPHLAAARAFLLLGFLNYLEFGGSLSWQRLIKGGLIWIGLGLMQPLTALIGWYIIFLHAGTKMIFSPKVERISRIKMIIRAMLPAGAVAPLIIYTYLRFANDPFLMEWTKQNLILSPPVGDYLLAWGGILPFAIIGGWRALRKKVSSSDFLAIWAICGFFLAYFPYNLQRRLPEGVWVALVILGVMCIGKLCKPYLELSRIWLGLGLLSSLIFFLGGVRALLEPGNPLYRQREEIKAFNYLASNADFNDVVLASFSLSNALPAWAPVRTLIGHGPESINLSEINERVIRYFKDPASEMELVKTFDIKYILLGPERYEFSSPNSNDNKYQFVEVFNDKGYRIIQILHNE